MTAANPAVPAREPYYSEEEEACGRMKPASLSRRRWVLPTKRIAVIVGPYFDVKRLPQTQQRSGRFDEERSQVIVSQSDDAVRP